MHQRFAERRNTVSSQRRRRLLRHALRATSAIALAATLLWAAHSPLTVLQDVQIDGLHRLEPHEVATQLPLRPGMPLHTTLTAAGAEQLTTHPAVDRVTLSRPDPVSVRYHIVEHAADYVIASTTHNQQRVVTADGQVIADQLAPADQPLPVVTIGGRLPAVGERLASAEQAAIDLHRQLPDDIAEATTQIGATDPADTRLRLEGGLQVRIGDVHLIDAKITSYRAVLDDLDRQQQTAETIDVRVPTHPTARTIDCPGEDC